MRQATILAALSALTAVVAQQNFTVDPNKVDPTTRTQWCNAEFNSCGILCGSQTKVNTCTPSTLKFECTCQNGTAPGLQYYIQTMPTLLCEQAFRDCIEKNAGDPIAQDKCTKDIKNNCGTLDPAKASVGGPASTDTSPSSSGTATGTGASATTSSQRAAGPTHAAHGAVAVAAGILAAALL